MNCEAPYGDMKYWIWLRLSLSKPLTSAGRSVTRDLRPREKLYMFWTTLVTTSRLILPAVLPLWCWSWRLTDASLSLSRSSSMLSTSLPRLASLVWHLSNSCSSPSMIPVTWVSSSFSLSLSLLESRSWSNDEHWILLGEHDDRSNRGEDSACKDAHSDHRISSDQSSYQSCAQHWAAHGGGDVAILLVFHILHLNLMNLIGDIFQCLNSKFNLWIIWPQENN